MFSQIVEFFVKHRTAANLIMIVMIIVGGMSAARLNKQFFPSIDVEVIGVTVEWSGAQQKMWTATSSSRLSRNCAPSPM